MQDGLSVRDWTLGRSLTRYPCPRIRAADLNRGCIGPSPSSHPANYFNFNTDRRLRSAWAHRRSYWSIRRCRPSGSCRTRPVAGQSFWQVLAVLLPRGADKLATPTRAAIEMALNLRRRGLSPLSNSNEFAAVESSQQAQ